MGSICDASEESEADAEGRVLSEWIQVLVNPNVVVPAIINGSFVLGGAFLGTYFSGKYSSRISRLERYERKREEFNDLKLILDQLENMVPDFHHNDKMDALKRAKVLSMLNVIKKDGLTEKFFSVKKPPTVDYFSLENYRQNLDFLNYLFEQQRYDLLSNALMNYKSSVRVMKILMKGYYHY